MTDVHHLTGVHVDRYGHKTVRTTVDLGGFERHQLRIETTKCGGSVDTDATVVVLSEDGNGFTHTFGLRCLLSGDWRKTLIREQGVRATEKALKTQHAAALVCLDDILAQARGHYVAKQARSEEQARKRGEAFLDEQAKALNLNAG